MKRITSLILLLLFALTLAACGQKTAEEQDGTNPSSSWTPAIPCPATWT